MQEGDRPTSPRLERGPRGLRRQGKRERRTRRSRMVGGDWTGKVSTDESAVSTLLRKTDLH